MCMYVFLNTKLCAYLRFASDQDKNTHISISKQ